MIWLLLLLLFVPLLPPPLLLVNILLSLSLAPQMLQLELEAEFTNVHFGQRNDEIAAAPLRLFSPLVSELLVLRLKKSHTLLDLRDFRLSPILILFFPAILCLSSMRSSKKSSAKDSVRRPQLSLLYGRPVSNGERDTATERAGFTFERTLRILTPCPTSLLSGTGRWSRREGRDLDPVGVFVHFRSTGRPSELRLLEETAEHSEAQRGSNGQQHK